MRFVAIRSIEQVDVQAIHCVREQSIRNPTAIINPIRTFLIEYGITIPVGRCNPMKRAGDTGRSEEQCLICDASIAQSTANSPLADLGGVR